MCFYNDDCDWVAECQDERHVKAEDRCRCVDCHRRIAAGEWVRRIEQSEHECCQICEDSESLLYEYPDEYEPESGMYGPTEHPHYYGEHWLGFICRECLLLREAIWDLEEKEGCPVDSRQPAYGELDEVMHEDQAHWGNRQYTNHALQLFPSLAWHRLIRKRALECIA
jgi:hypothetical protein